MRKDLAYPKTEAIASVLTKIGVDPNTRMAAFGQDIEYTSCRLVELDQYVALYEEPTTSIYEKRVLGCYFLECLNDHIQVKQTIHPLQNRIFTLLFSDQEIHATEIAYWTNTSHSKNEADWWAVTKEILNWINTKR